MFRRNWKNKISKLTAGLLSIALLCTLLPLQLFAGGGQDHTADQDIIRNSSISYQLKGQTSFAELKPPYKIDDITKVQSFRLSHIFSLTDTEDSLSGTVKRSVQAGDYYIIDLPEKLIVTNPSAGYILGNENKPIANYSFIEESHSKWKLKIEFTDYVDNPNEYNIHGSMNFDFELDPNALEDGQTTQIYIPIDDKNGITLNITKPLPPPTKPVSLNKTVVKYTPQSRELVWNVKIMPETGIFSGCIFTDTLDANLYTLKSIKHGAEILTEGADYTYDAATGAVRYVIPDGRSGKNYQNIELTTIVKSDVYNSLLPTVISNKAHLSGGENAVDIDSNTKEYAITPDWLQKSGTVIEGNKIKWTLTVNATRQKMYNAVVTDHLQADVQFDKTSLMLGNETIPVYENSHTPAADTETYAIYTEYPDKTADLSIHFPTGQSNASDSALSIHFVTSVAAPSNAADPDPVYNNTASMTADFTGDGGKMHTLPKIDLSTVGVGIPHVSIVKGNAAITPEDKRNGTITWTIDAASNLSEYGKSVITDTLPDDQDFLPNEIYWGSQKIDNTTEPKAEISADGRTLTITFSEPKALTVQQHFTVKTKMKTAVYGQNVKRDFYNYVQADLYDITDSSAVSTTGMVSHKVNISNTVIAKSSALYKDNTSGHGINPMVNFSITINGNLMPLSDITVTDDLNRIVTEFKKDGASAYAPIENVKWTYVPGSLRIVKNQGSLDHLDLNSIAAAAVYQDNTLSVSFGSGIAVNDKYTIHFTAELDIGQNGIFKDNGSIRCSGNIAEIDGTGLKTGAVSSPATGNTSDIKNEILSKSGTHMEKEQQAIWTINLNQHRVTLRSTTVIDVLPAGLTLDPTSIKLYTNVIGADGNFISANEVETKGTAVDFTYTYLPAVMAGYEGRYVLTVTLPDDNTDYTLRFATDIDNALLGKQISNSAYYTGDEGIADNTDTSSMTFSNVSGGGSTTKTSVTVYKKSKDSGKAVDTAVFQLAWLRGGDPADAVFVRSLSTTGGSVIFRGLTKGEKYAITETGAPGGYILDNPNPVVITAPANGSGDAEALTFYDTPVKTGSWTPAAIKKLDGKDIIRPFRFALKDAAETVMDGVTKTALSNGNYTVEFTLSDGVKAEDVLYFTDSHIFSESDPAGTRYLAAARHFTMSEIPFTSDGYGFDTAPRYFTVKAYNVKGQSALEIVIEDDQGTVISDTNGNFKPADIPVFQNTYRADGSIQLSAEKIVSGHSLEAGRFLFELYEGSTLIGTVSNGEGSFIGDKTYAANILFDQIPYAQSDVGTKVYRIVEKNTALSGYTYDQTEYTVTVLITDHDNGKLTAAVQHIAKTAAGIVSETDQIRFTNTYTASNTDALITAAKTLSGRTLADGQFTFRLRQVTADGVWIRDIADAVNQSGVIAFPKITYQQSDIGASYYYQISELDEGKEGYTYDDSVYTLKIDITDNHNGTISATQTLSKNGAKADAAVFSNTYKAAGSTTISGTKTLAGKILPANQFTFVLQQFDPITTSPISEPYSAKNDSGGNFVFPEISYNETDAGNTYSYYVSEIDEKAGGYTYDTAVYTVEVQVSDNGDGTLAILQSITNPADTGKIQFNNVYTTANTAADFTAQKILNGRILEEGQFSFALIQVMADGTLIREIQTAKNNENGRIAFDDILYTQADMGNSYYYQIYESKEANPGYGYDASVYTIKIDVIDNGDGTLSTAKTLTREGYAVLGAIFTNTYTTTNTTAAFTAHKELTGRTLEDGQFRFLLIQKGTGGAPDTEIETAVNLEDGSIVFTPLTYTQEDMGKIFTYTITEVNESKPGYTYDSTVYTVEVTVSDNGDGSLKTQIQLSADGKAADKVQFVNAYQEEIIPPVPNTGDAAILHSCAVIAVLSFASILYFRKKQQG